MNIPSLRIQPLVFFLVLGLSVFAISSKAKADGIEVGRVYFSNGNEEILGSEFTYGLKLYIVFANVTGMVREEGKIYPGLEMKVQDAEGNTILTYEDLYAESDGFDPDPIDLFTHLILANPLTSDASYSVVINIWDKKSEARYSTKVDLRLKPNERINVNANKSIYNEIYLWSQNTGLTLTDNQARVSDNIYFIIEGLSGFKVEEGMIYAGLSILLKGQDGEILVDEKDLLGDSGMKQSDFEKQIAPNITLSSPDVVNPLTYEVKIWDKRSDATLEVSTQLYFK